MCTAVLISRDPATSPPHAFGLIYEDAIGQQDRRHRFVTHWLNTIPLMFILAYGSFTLVIKWFFSYLRRWTK